MSGDGITRQQELLTQATQACLNAIRGDVTAGIYNHNSVKTSLEVMETRTDAEPGNMIVQESIWSEEDGKFRYRLLVAVVVERERIVPEVQPSGRATGARSRPVTDQATGSVLPISEESAAAMGLPGYGADE